MRTIRRLIYGEVFSAVAFVTLGFLALFFFFDFVEELQSIGRNGAAGYQLVHALEIRVLTITIVSVARLNLKLPEHRDA